MEEDISKIESKLKQQIQQSQEVTEALKRMLAELDKQKEIKKRKLKK